MKLVRYGKTKHREKFGRENAHYDVEEGVVYLPYKSSTGVRLHERYHSDISPYREDLEYGSSWDQVAEEEISARHYSKTMRGRDIDTQDMGYVARFLRELGATKAQSMASVIRAVDKLGYDMSGREIRSNLWQRIK